MFSFDNTYVRLPDRFFARVLPAKVRAPRMIAYNRKLADELGADLTRLESPEGAEVLAGNVVPDGADPIALAYAGHQFGVFVPQLGDGRAILLGEVVGKDGRRRDVQLKGAGRTPFSRGGDGRAALGPVLREYVVSEAMAALGIPTTRTLAAVATGEPVFREQVLPGAVLTRIAASHLRVGTFQYFAVRGDKEALSLLTSYALERHYPEAARSDNLALALLDRVVLAQAELVAAWLGVGFVHGVMNTDNTSISGETLDYGPCAFLDEFDPNKRFSSIDHGGRYAFGNQPRIAEWNLIRLAQTLLPLLDDEEQDAVRIAKESVERFPSEFEEAYARVLRKKIGLATELEEDSALAGDLLDRLASNGVDFTIFFRGFCACATDPAADASVARLFAEPNDFHDWAAAWRKRTAGEAVSPEDRAIAMRRANPAFIPRNHRVEQAIAAAVQHADFAPFERLVQVLARPFDDQPSHAELAEPPTLDERVVETFCGT
jgi:uncharacterized protein YdiU (UPF0061 family)